jgi:hypothetical protein
MGSSAFGGLIKKAKGPCSIINRSRAATRTKNPNKGEKEFAVNMTKAARESENPK